jgi:uncharacterized protein YjiS (DUF1127 family)
MSYVFQSKIDIATSRWSQWAIRVRSALQGFAAEVVAARRYAAARRDFSRVNDSTLRDLGISRCEFDSYWAENNGLAEPTRVRVTRDPRGRAS